DYDPDVHAITPRDMLIHTRLVNLFLQPMRRLADMYRFVIPSPTWVESSEAATQPGTVFPISYEERLVNCYFYGTCCTHGRPLPNTRRGIPAAYAPARWLLPL